MSSTIVVWRHLRNGSLERTEIDPAQIGAIFHWQGEWSIVVMKGKSVNVQDENTIVLDKMAAALLDEQWSMWKRGQEAMPPKPFIHTLTELIQDRLDVMERNRKGRRR